MSLSNVLLSCFLVLIIFPLSSYYPQFPDEETEAQKSGSDWPKIQQLISREPGYPLNFLLEIYSLTIAEADDHF